MERQSVRNARPAWISRAQLFVARGTWIPPDPRLILGFPIKRAVGCGFMWTMFYSICIAHLHVCALAFAAQDALRLGCAAPVRGDQRARRTLERFARLPLLGDARSG